MNLSNRIVLALSGCALAMAGFALAGSSDHRDRVIRVDSAKGTALVREARTGRVMAFRPSPDALEKIKVGDEVKADWKARTLTFLKGLATAVALVEPDALEPCCNVVAVIKDRATVQALLGGLFAGADANPAGTPGKPNTNTAGPGNSLRDRVISVDAVEGIKADFGSLLDGAEPINDIVVVRNTTTGAMHMLNLSVLAPDETTQTSAPITGSVKIGDPVSIDPATGIAMLKSGTGTYAFNLRGVKRDAEPSGSDKPWVVEPDPKAEGRNGIVRTNWPEKTSSNFQAIYVYLPGKRDADEYHEFFKTEHKVMEGEYDMKVNGMMLERVPVKAGHATRIRLGALRSTAAYSSQLAIMDSKDRLVMKIQGTQTIALPVGTYHFKVGTRTVSVVIKEGVVTDF